MRSLIDARGLEFSMPRTLPVPAHAMTGGFDCRAPRIIVDWMVSIPARRSLEANDASTWLLIAAQRGRHVQPTLGQALEFWLLLRGGRGRVGRAYRRAAQTHTSSQSRGSRPKGPARPLRPRSRHGRHQRPEHRFRLRASIRASHTQDVVRLPRCIRIPRCADPRPERRDHAVRYILATQVADDSPTRPHCFETDVSDPPVEFPRDAPT